MVQENMPFTKELKDTLYNSFFGKTTFGKERLKSITKYEDIYEKIDISVILKKNMPKRIILLNYICILCFLQCNIL